MSDEEKVVVPRVATVEEEAAFKKQLQEFLADKNGAEYTTPPRALGAMRQEIPGWEPRYCSATMSYAARSPDFKRTGIEIHGRKAAEVIFKVLRLEKRLGVTRRFVQSIAQEGSDGERKAADEEGGAVDRSVDEG